MARHPWLALFLAFTLMGGLAACGQRPTPIYITVTSEITATGPAAQLPAEPTAAPLATRVVGYRRC